MIGLGATKAGTSWLFRHLQAHPDCHLRQVKELHFFDTQEEAGWHRAIAEVDDRIAAADRVIARRKGDTATQALRADLLDWRQVLLDKGQDRAAYAAYLAAGRPATARVVGEITPAYAALPEARLSAMAAIAPDVRFVYLMRDPLSRMWSHLRMLARRRVAPAHHQAEALALLRGIVAGKADGAGAMVVQRGDYRGALGRFARAIDPSRLLVMFAEDLFTAAGIARLAGFLGIAETTPDLDRRMHEGAALDLPEGDRAAARAFLRPQYDHVASRFAHLPDAWRANYEEGYA